MSATFTYTPADPINHTDPEYTLDQAKEFTVTVSHILGEVEFWVGEEHHGPNGFEIIDHGTFDSLEDAQNHAITTAIAGGKMDAPDVGDDILRP